MKHKKKMVAIDKDEKVAKSREESPRYREGFEKAYERARLILTQGFSDDTETIFTTASGKRLRQASG